MKLDEGKMYSISMNDDSSYVVRVYKDEGDGWYRVKSAVWRRDEEAKGSFFRINLNNAVTVEEYHY